jgi:geranylgeranyl diphosphate synthase type I
MSVQSLQAPPVARVPRSTLDTDDIQDRLGEVELVMRMLAAGGRLDRAGVMVQEHLATGGKRLRARLALAAADALGATGDARPWAAAVELLHNATLIHDDIQDGDRVRRGQPTTWVRHGVAQAINAGDLMLMLPFLALARGDAPGDVAAALAICLAGQAATTVRGQVDELDLLPGGHLDQASYDRAVRGKTGGLFGLPVEGAALLAGRTPDEARALARPFGELGLLFQLQDDVLDLYGDKGREAAGADIREGKVSALVVAHLARVPHDRAWLLGVLAADRDATPDVAVQEVIARFRASGALDDVLDRIRAIAADIRADAALAQAPALRRVALEITAVVLQPIDHLFTP